MALEPARQHAPGSSHAAGAHAPASHIRTCSGDAMFVLPHVPRDRSFARNEGKTIPLQVRAPATHRPVPIPCRKPPALRAMEPAIPATPGRTFPSSSCLAPCRRSAILPLPESRPATPVLGGRGRSAKSVLCFSPLPSSQTGASPRAGAGGREGGENRSSRLLAISFFTRWRKPFHTTTYGPTDGKAGRTDFYSNIGKPETDSSPKRTQSLYLQRTMSIFAI